MTRRVVSWLVILLVSAAALAAACGCAAPMSPKPPVQFTETIEAKGRKASFDMVLIPGGRLLMGSPTTEKGRRNDEGPQHPVKLRPFYLCVTETTWELFLTYWADTKEVPWLAEHRLRTFSNLDLARIYNVDAVTRASDDSADFRAWRRSMTEPVHQITWEQAAEVCRWLRKKTGRPYRLPSEAEWEHACRGGSRSAYSFGNDAGNLDDYGWFAENAAEIRYPGPQPVAEKRPNAWGLYDMHGNVMEWCHDLFDPRAYEKNAGGRPARDPFGPACPLVPTVRPTPRDAPYHVARGGSCDAPPEALRSAARARELPQWRDHDPREPRSWWWLPQVPVGFRLACDICPRRTP